MTGFKKYTDINWNWCKPCQIYNLQRNFKNWTSGNKNIDEFIQHSQLNSLSWLNCLEWVPFEKFQNVTYITRGGFCKVYSAEDILVIGILKIKNGVKE